MEEEGAPVSFPFVVENEDKLEELDEEGVEDPEEGEVGPVGVVVVEEVEDESLDIRCDVKKWQNYIENKKLDKLQNLHFEIVTVNKVYIWPFSSLVITI